MKRQNRQFILIWIVGLFMVLFPLLAHAAETPNISVSPMSINLGSVKVGGTAQRNLTIKNTGNEDLVINSISMSDTTEFAFSGADGCPNPIPAKGSCQLTVTFSPEEPFGKKSAVLSIASNAPKSTVKVKLSGQVPPPKISAAPMSVNFGTLTVGSTSGAKTVIIKNTGLSDLSISDISIDGVNPDDFNQTNDCSVITKGSTCGVDITFSPSLSNSKESAILNISSNDPKKSDLSVKLTGRGGAITIVSITVTPVNPTIAVGTTQQFAAMGTYSNNATQDLTARVSWNSSSASVAAINTSGLATGVSAGDSAITATFGSISGSSTLEVTSGPVATDNVMAVTVNGSLCSPSTSLNYPNKPCVSVTVCTTGTSNCQTINDILLDTGSYGLRIFSQVLTVPLTQVTVASGDLVNCVQFGDSSSDWGPVQVAKVILANEPAVEVPIQVIDSTFGTRPSFCQNADTSPENTGFNGILGVGFFAQDCGSSCVTDAGVGHYYACNGSSCTGTVVSLSNQVQNPVTLLPKDNNGVLLQLPSVPAGGLQSVEDGFLILGIGTRSNNVPSGVKAYPANQFGEFSTTFRGDLLSSFIDSGSNGLYFPPPSGGLLPACPSPDSAWYCPAHTTSLSATNTGASGSPSGVVSFQIGNFESLFATSNSVFSEIGGDVGNVFDWGLPFFFGRSVFVGFEGGDSSLGTGPYWAY